MISRSRATDAQADPSRPYQARDERTELPQRPVLITAARLPDGDASAIRQWQLARSATPDGVPALLVGGRASGGALGSQIRVISDATLLTLDEPSGSRINRFFGRQIRPFRAIRALRSVGVGRGDVSAILLPMAQLTLCTWALLRIRMQCPVIVDATERHDHRQFNHGRLTPYFLRHRWSTFLTTRLADRVTAVSSTLAASLARPGLEVLVVPPLVDCQEFSPHRQPSLTDGLRLIYAGTPGRKDLLEVLLKGIGQLDDAKQRRIHLTIAGLAEAELAECDLRRSTLRGVSAKVTMLGRIPRSDVLALLSESHFSVLVRPQSGYAAHGFPSKVPESLAAGCPVLLNLTSDLARFVRDGVEGLVLEGPQPADVRRGLERALTLEHEQWVDMSRAAHTRAKEGFDIEVWRSTVSKFAADGRPPLDNIECYASQSKEHPA